MGTNSEVPKTGQQAIRDILRRITVLERAPRGLPFISEYPNPSSLVIRTADGTIKAADPTDPDDLATKSYVDAGVVTTPPGIVELYAGTTAPSGYLLCDGSAVSRTTYAALFAIIGTTYGVGDGSTTFNVPNLKGRVPVGLDSSQVEFDALGETGGAKTHTLTIAEMPSHDHGGNTGATNPNANFNLTVAGSNPSSPSHIVRGTSTGSVANAISGASHSHPITAQGGGTAHNNLQPYLVMNYIIHY